MWFELQDTPEHSSTYNSDRPDSRASQAVSRDLPVDAASSRLYGAGGFAEAFRHGASSRRRVNVARQKMP